MGDNIYTLFWQSQLESIVSAFSSGDLIFQIEVKELAKYGNRTQGYYSNFRITNGVLETPKSAHAPGRDLFAVLLGDSYFKEFAANKTIHVTITKNLILTMEVIDINAPDFFSEEDFIELSRFTKQTMDNNNPQHKATYEVLKNTYTKHEYWAREVQQKIFPNGSVQIRKRPTNQANKFEEYQWAKIYPDKVSLQYAALAFTIGIDTDYRFTVKIDTISLPEANIRRQAYLQVRGDYDNSAIVKHLPEDQVLDKGWKYLIDLTSDIILTLKPQYDSLLQSFLGNIQTSAIQPPLKNNIAMALNTILYGPPGTGKTYTMQSMCNKFIITKAVQTRQEFLEDLISKTTWWETIAAALMQLKASSVPDLEKHEFIQIKSKQSTTSNVKQMIWGSLQNRTDPSCEFVKFTDRREPYIFMKDEKSVWTILEDRVKNEAPEIIDFLTAVNNFKPATGSVQKNYRMVTFHQSFSYEDFIEGIKPIFDKDNVDDLQYEIAHGLFFQACNDAAKLAGYDNLNDCINDSKQERKKKIEAAPQYALFIDEVNRANVSAVFGELITLIEDDKRLGKENEIIDIILPYSKMKFGVPGNLYLIGTMNTADRSVEALDTALRRRFVFEEISPDPEVLSSYHLLHRLWYKHWFAELNEEDWNEWEKVEAEFGVMVGMNKDEAKYIALDKSFSQKGKEIEWVKANPIELFKGIVTFNNGIDLVKLLDTINLRLKALLTRDHIIGHAWLMNVYSLQDLQIAFKNKILPLLQEFFYNDFAKIGLVLGDAFVQQKPVGKSLFSNFKDSSELASDYEDKIIYTLTDPAHIDLDGFKSIYK